MRATLTITHSNLDSGISKLPYLLKFICICNSVKKQKPDSRKGVPFSALVDIAAHLRDQIAQKPQFWRSE